MTKALVLTGNTIVSFSREALEEFFTAVVDTSISSLAKGFGHAHCSAEACVDSIENVLYAENVPFIFVMSFADGGDFATGTIQEFANAAYTCIDELSAELTGAVAEAFPYGTTGNGLAEWISDNSGRIADSLATTMADLTKCCISDAAAFAV